MAVTTAALSGTITDLTGTLETNYLARVVAVIEANTPGSLLLDTDGNRVMAGAKRVDIDKTTGAYTITLPRTDSTDILPTGARLYRATLIYPSGTPGAKNVTVQSGWFELETDGSLSDADKWPGLEVTVVSQAVLDSIGDMAADVETRHADVMGVVATTEGLMTSVIGSGGTFDTELSDTIASQIDAEANDANSDLRLTLNGVFRPAVPRVADLPRPFIIAHRGAGALLAPENTLESFKIGATLRTGMIDGGDWYVSADDNLVCCHNATVDAMTDRTGTVASFSTMALSRMNVDASSWFGAGFTDTKLMSDGEFFNTFAGLYPFSPEPKELRAAQLLAERIDSLGLQQSVLPTAFDTLSMVQPFLDAGCTDVLINITSMPSAPTRAAWYAAGVRWIGVTYNGTVTVANVQTLVSEGFEILLGTVNRKHHLTSTHNWASIINDISAFASDDPIYFAHALDSANATRYRRTSDPYANRTHYHGHIPTVDGGVGEKYRGAYMNGDRWGLNQNTFGSAWVLQGWACPLASPTSYTLDATVVFDNPGTDTTRWVGVWLGQDTDAAYADASATTENGYQLFFRGNGSMNWVEKNAGVAGSTTTTSTTAVSAPLTLSSGLTSGVAVTALPVNAIPSNLASGAKLALPTGQIATLSGAATAGATSVAVTSITPSAAIASGASIPQAIPMRIVVNSSTITWTRLDTSTVVTIGDTTHRGPYFFFGFNDLGSTANGFRASFCDVTIT